jgi:hypothetical protein
VEWLQLRNSERTLKERLQLLRACWTWAIERRLLHTVDLLRESAREGTEQLYVDNGSNEVES